MKNETALSRAVSAAGGAAAFLSAASISLRTLASWRRDGVPDTRWRDVVRASNGAVSVEDLAMDRAASLVDAR
jgi:hypothetical protein